jgi:hypothetical protein
MKSLFSVLSVLAIFLASNLYAQDSSQDPSKEQYRNKNRTKTATQNQPKNQNKTGFVDENGDGYNDNAPDHDGDGIPNGRDEDYTGSKNRKGNSSKGFVDADGDGVNDNALDADGDGIPNGQDSDFIRPQDGTGRKNQSSYGKKKGTKGTGIGTGECDGTGPKGNQKRGGKN